MARYFNIDYEFDRDEVHRRIARRWQQVLNKTAERTT